MLNMDQDLIFDWEQRKPRVARRVREHRCAVEAFFIEQLRTSSIKGRQSEGRAISLYRMRELLLQQRSEGHD